MLVSATRTALECFNHQTIICIYEILNIVRKIARIRSEGLGVKSLGEGQFTASAVFGNLYQIIAIGGYVYTVNCVEVSLAVKTQLTPHPVSDNCSSESKVCIQTERRILWVEERMPVPCTVTAAS